LFATQQSATSTTATGRTFKGLTDEERVDNPSQVVRGDRMTHLVDDVAKG
jgi:hypothetical protein